MSKYKEYHDLITMCYYKKIPFKGEILTKEKFDLLHGLNSLLECEANPTRQLQDCIQTDLQQIRNKVVDMGLIYSLDDIGTEKPKVEAEIAKRVADKIDAGVGR